MFMKQGKIRKLALILLLASGTAIYFEACKKEVITPINNKVDQQVDYSGYSDEARNVVGKIKKFKRQLVDKEAVMRSGLTMSVDSVVWNLEALFNSEYAYPERKYLETVKHDIEFFIDVDAGGEVPFGDVADLYDDITNEVRQVYANDGIDTDKSLLAVVVDKGEVVGNRVKLDVRVVSGRAEADNSNKNPVSGPFGPGDCWYFGEYGGTCDDPSVFGDAAEIIEDTINYYYGGKTVPRPGFRYLNTGMFMVSLDGNEYVDENGEPYLFFSGVNTNPELYFDYELLNYYYAREIEVLMHLLPSDPVFQSAMPIQPAFIEVDIVGMLGYVGNGSYYHHKNYVIYGSKIAIPDQELPPLRDLLN